MQNKLNKIFYILFQKCHPIQVIILNIRIQTFPETEN